MGGTGRKREPSPHDGKSKTTPQKPPRDDDDVDDGDFATPKRDRNGSDDEPL